MPQYIVVHVDDIPAPETMASGMVLRITAADETEALKLAAGRLKSTTTGVYGVTLAANITRRVLTPTTPPDWTIT